MEKRDGYYKVVMQSSLINAMLRYDSERIVGSRSVLFEEDFNWTTQQIPNEFRLARKNEAGEVVAEVRSKT